MKKKLRIVCFSLLLPGFFLLIFASANGQQYNNWFFGLGAAASFNDDAFPIPHPVFGSKMKTNEACSSVSNERGQLLFYTNGETAYDSNHDIMLNGTGLSGSESATQGALIVPWPNHDSLFYIFTTDAIENNFRKGYCYSVVNMNRNNGKGEVITKNIVLQSSCTERLTAARHANGIDIWIITNDPNSNTFRCWLITCDGLQTTPIVSNAGVILNKDPRMNMGYLKISPDGKKLCQSFFPGDDQPAGVNNFFQLFDFNNNSGQVSNGLQIMLPNSNAYACEFSADSKLLYLTDPSSKLITQVECSLLTATAIASSAISFPCDYGYYPIQLAPDGRIYLNKGGDHLSVINNPNSKGTGCGFKENNFPLGTDGRIGLPSILKDLTETGNDFTFFHADSCNGIVQFNGRTVLPNAHWQWDFGDGTTSTAQSPQHTFNPSNKIYLVRLKITSSTICGSILKQRYVVPRGTLVKADFNFEGKCDSGYVRFTNTSQYLDSVQFFWDFGDGTSSSELNPVHAYPSSGTYHARLMVKGSTACINDSVTKILNLTQLDIHASGDVTILEGQSTQLEAFGNAIQFSWTPSTWLSNPLIKNPFSAPEQNITYYVSAKNDAGCIDIDSVHITVKPLNDIYVPNAFTPNGDGRNDSFKPIVGLQFDLLEFGVYNRWGQLVFSTSQKGKAWDGRINNKPQDSGIYVWKLKAVIKQDKKQINKTGTVLLIR